ncbi:nuclease-related domain-containing protein [Virgibacillus sp. YIM 98842]|uniref:nuclease-related domain-containing protein n=1 Tax=Virgibacillus sp. YIM 98842 TaxID=2663533 RepID=UPI0013D97E4C|nr:nuclease-related domain-containing protein [Virgibacillus sp. YIM 98842]
MQYKERKKPYELEVLEYLDIRMRLSSKDKQYYYALKKGYEGEILFDSLTEKLQCECYILNDLLLNSNNSTFQIDTLIITSETIHLFEVKNLDGDYYYDEESGKFYKISKIPQSEITNPLHQLDRKESLLRKLLFKHGCNLPISPSVVFIHSEFTLYQAQLNQPIIYPNQIKRYLNGYSDYRVENLINQLMFIAP